MRRWGGTVALLIVAVAVLTTAPGWAQTDPYSGGRIGAQTPCNGGTPTVSVDKEAGLFVGDPLVATGTGWPAAAPITVVFDGKPFGTGNADPSGAFSVTGAVPNVPIGHYDVCASGPPCAAACTDPALDVLGIRPAVLGTQFVRTGDRSGLARTGIEVGLLVLVALGLIALGIGLRRRARSVPRRTRG